MAEYRILKSNEILQYGDQYKWHGEWINTVLIGRTVAEDGTNVFDYRREVDHGRSTAENK